MFYISSIIWDELVAKQVNNFILWFLFKKFFYPFLLITKHTLKCWNEWLQIQKINSLMMSSHKGQAS